MCLVKGKEGRLYSKSAFTDNRCAFFGVTVDAFGCLRFYMISNVVQPNISLGGGGC